MTSKARTSRDLLIALTVASVTLTTGSIAGSVSSLNTFQVGGLISAGQMNENFSLLSTAVNDNNARLSAVEQDLDTLSIGDSVAVDCSTDPTALQSAVDASLPPLGNVTTLDLSGDCGALALHDRSNYFITGTGRIVSSTGLALSLRNARNIFIDGVDIAGGVPQTAAVRIDDHSSLGFVNATITANGDSAVSVRNQSSLRVCGATILDGTNAEAISAKSSSVFSSDEACTGGGSALGEISAYLYSTIEVTGAQTSVGSVLLCGNGVGLFSGVDLSSAPVEVCSGGSFFAADGTLLSSVEVSGASIALEGALTELQSGGTLILESGARLELDGELALNGAVSVSQSQVTLFEDNGLVPTIGGTISLDFFSSLDADYDLAAATESTISCGSASIAQDSAGAICTGFAASGGGLPIP